MHSDLNYSGIISWYDYVDSGIFISSYIFKNTQ